VDDLAHAAELQVSEELHTKFALGVQDLPKWHYIKGHIVDSILHAQSDGPPKVGCQQHQAGIQDMQGA